MNRFVLSTVCGLAVMIGFSVAASDSTASLVTVHAPGVAVDVGGCAGVHVAVCGRVARCGIIRRGIERRHERRHLRQARRHARLAAGCAGVQASVVGCS